MEIEPPSGGHNLRRSGAAPDDVSIAVDEMLAAERPVLFIGHGVNLSEAAEELTALAHRLRIPEISSPNGRGCILVDDDLSLSFIGRNGVYPANKAGRRANLVIAIGGPVRRPLGLIVAARLFVEFSSHRADSC